MLGECSATELHSQPNLVLMAGLAFSLLDVLFNASQLKTYIQFNSQEAAWFVVLSRSCQQLKGHNSLILFDSFDFPSSYLHC